jgi:hypothetical protein
MYTRLSRLIPLSALVVLGAFRCPAEEPAQVRSVSTLHLPDHPLQPRVALQDHTIHLVYLTGDPRHCDVQYRRWSPTDKAFSDPVRVNSQSGSAVAVGTVRGCELAGEPSGRIHVVWNGSEQAQPRQQGSMKEEGSPVCYTHSDDGKTFTPQQSVLTSSWYLDGGASIAVLGGSAVPAEKGGPAVPAGSSPRIAIVWHAADASKPPGEQNRGIFIAWSDDRGQTFKPEVRQPDATDGACGCCGLHAFADATGHLGILYRRAFNGSERDETLLLEREGKWSRTRLDPWPTGTCPMTTSDAFVVKDGVLLAWETQGQVWVGKWNGELVQTMTAAPGKPDKRKHPRVTALPTGEILLAWTEGTAWEKGGSVAWQQFDATLKPVEGASGHAEGLPTWGTAAVMPTGNHFTLLY